MPHFRNEKRPEEAHLLGLTGSCCAHGEQRGPGMWIAVRVGAIRCFSAPQPRPEQFGKLWSVVADCCLLLELQGYCA